MIAIKIDDRFEIGGKQWRCTDVGTRVVVAICLNKPDTSWYNGPPYAVAELVFDEDDQKAMKLIT